MIVELSAASKLDLRVISDYIAIDSPDRAEKFVDVILDRCLEIGDAPKAYPLRPDIAEHIRSVAFRRYMIFYSLRPDHVRIERILHSSRNIVGGDFL